MTNFKTTPHAPVVASVVLTFTLTLLDSNSQTTLKAYRGVPGIYQADGTSDTFHKMGRRTRRRAREALSFDYYMYYRTRYQF